MVREEIITIKRIGLIYLKTNKTMKLLNQGYNYLFCERCGYERYHYYSIELNKWKCTYCSSSRDNKTVGNI